MDPTTATLNLLSFLRIYGPLGVMAALGYGLFFYERRQTKLERDRAQNLSDKLHEVGMSAIQADMEHNKDRENYERLLDGLITKITRSN